MRACSPNGEARVFAVEGPTYDDDLALRHDHYVLPAIAHRRGHARALALTIAKEVDPPTLDLIRGGRDTPASG